MASDGGIVDETRQLETREIIANEESLEQLRLQTRKIQDLLAMSLEKDRAIEELKKKLAYLAPFEQECHELRNELKILGERAKLREAEAVMKNNELSRRLAEATALGEAVQKSTSLHSTLPQNESSDESNTIRTLKARLSEVEGRYEALVADSDRRQLLLQRLEYELAVSSQHAHSMKSKLKVEELRKEDMQKVREASGEQINLLKEQVSHANHQYQQAKQLADDLQGQIDTFDQENMRLKVRLAEEQRKCDICKREKEELFQRLKVYSAEHSQVASWQEAASKNQAMEKEKVELQSQIALLQQDGEHWRAKTEADAQEIERLNLSIRELMQAEEDRIRRESDSHSGLKESQRRVERLTAELGEERQRSDDLRHQVATLKQEQAESAGGLEDERNSMLLGLNGMQRMMENAAVNLLAFDPSLYSQTLSSHTKHVGEEGSTSAVDLALIGLQSRVFNIIKQSKDAEVKSKQLQKEVSSTAAQLREYDVQSLERQMTLAKAEERVRELEGILRQRDDSTATIRFDLEEALQQLRQFGEEMQKRESFMRRLCEKCSDFYSSPEVAQLSTTHADTTTYTMLPEGASVLQMQSILNEQVEQLIALNAMLRSQKLDIANEKEKALRLLKENENLVEFAKAEHQEELIKSRLEHENSLEEYRLREEDTRRALQADFSSQQEEMEGRIFELEHENANLNVSLKKAILSQSEVGQAREMTENMVRSLSDGLLLLLRAFLPLKMQVADLISQKQFLTLQAAQHKIIQHDLAALVRALGGDHDHESDIPTRFRSHQPLTFRTAALVVMASNRLQHLRRTSTWQYATIGRNRIALAPISASSSALRSMHANLPVLDLAPTALVQDQSYALAEHLLRIVKHYEGNQWDLLQSSRNTPGLLGAVAAPLGSLSSARTAASSLESLAHIRQTVLHLTRKLSEAEGTMHTASSETESLSAELERSANAVAMLTKKCEKSEDLLAFLQSRVLQLQEELVKAVSVEKYDSMRHELEAITKKYMLVLQEKEKYLSEFEGLSSSVHDFKAKFRLLEQEKEQVKEELKRAVNEAAEKSEELSSVYRYMKQKAAETVTLEDEQKRLRTLCSSHESELSSCQEKVQQLKSTLAERDRALEKSRNLNSRFESDILGVQDTRNELTRKVHDLSTENSRMKAEMKGLKDLSESLTKAHREAVSENYEFRVRLESLQATNSQLHEAVASAEGRELQERQDRREWAEARSQLLQVRTAAEADLHALVAHQMPFPAKEKDESESIGGALRESLERSMRDL